MINIRLPLTEKIFHTDVETEEEALSALYSARARLCDSLEDVNNQIAKLEGK